VAEWFKATVLKTANKVAVNAIFSISWATLYIPNHFNDILRRVGLIKTNPLAPFWHNITGAIVGTPASFVRL